MLDPSALIKASFEAGRDLFRATAPEEADVAPAASAPRRTGSVPIRSLGPSHRERITEHLLALDERDRYLRFGYAANDAQIRRYADGLNFDRDDIFVTTKVWNTDHGYDETLRAFDKSTGLLGIDEVDLYLIHWPTPARDIYLDSWRALIRLREEGRARSIGVSNFHEAHLRKIIDETGVIPAINQIELHPWLPQTHMRDIDARLGIKTEAWSPLGSGRLIDDPVIADYVQGIWQPLMEAARARGELSAELDERFAWEILLGRDRTVNAFALPGGYLGVHLGLVGVVATRDELASVLAHELSHVTQRHQQEQTAMAARPRQQASQWRVHQGITQAQPGKPGHESATCPFKKRPGTSPQQGIENRCAGRTAF